MEAFFRQTVNSLYPRISPHLAQAFICYWQLFSYDLHGRIAGRSGNRNEEVSHSEPRVVGKDSNGPERRALNACDGQRVREPEILRHEVLRQLELLARYLAFDRYFVCDGFHDVEGVVEHSSFLFLQMPDEALTRVNVKDIFSLEFQGVGWFQLLVA